MQEKYEETIKVVFLHDSGVGAKQIFNIVIGGSFDEERYSFASTFFTLKNKKYILHFWDSSGTEKYSSMAKMFIKGSKLVIFIYDITNKNSFLKLDSLIEMAKEVVGDNAIFGIMGSKYDLYKYQVISDEEAYRFAESKGMKLKFVSAKNDPNGIRDFIKELAFDYLLTNKELNLKKTDLRYLKSDEKINENLNKNYIKILNKHNNY